MNSTGAEAEADGMIEWRRRKTASEEVVIAEELLKSLRKKARLVDLVQRKMAANGQSTEVLQTGNFNG